MSATKYHSASSPLLGHLFQESFTSTTRKRNGGMTVSTKKAKLSESNAKRANLSARKKERVKLPDYADAYGGNGICHISKFFSHPSGIEAILNRRALQSCQSLDSNVYRCKLPQIKFFNFEVAPVLDLQVTPTSEDCIVEMLSCKFEGSDVMERQNEHFSAFMRNHIKWETVDARPFLDFDVKLNLALEIYTQPFTMLPVSAVESPGNMVDGKEIVKLVCKEYVTTSANGHPPPRTHGPVNTQNDAGPSGPVSAIACATAAPRLRGLGSSPKQSPPTMTLNSSISGRLETIQH